MRFTGVSGFLLGVPRLSFRAKVFALAWLAAAIPFFSLVAANLLPPFFAGDGFQDLVVGLTGVASLATLLLLRSLLAALGPAAECARANATLAAVEPSQRADEVLRMVDDLTAVAARLETVRHRLANRHPVTGVSTREPLMAAVTKDLTSEGRGAGLLGVIRFAQLERLTAVDRPGADKALAAFAQRLTEALGGARPIAQVERDTFAVWFCDGGGPLAATEALKALADHLAGPLGEGQGKLTPDVRVGAAIYPDDGADARTLLARAMDAAGKADRMSAGRLAFYSETSSAEAQSRHVMEQALRQAILRRELALFYQPVIDLTDGRVVGAEALLRWRHPDVGAIPPAQFLPVLEQTGLIDEVGRWVLDAACRDAREFEALNIPGFRVGVNLSPRQFRDPTLAATVADTLRRHDIKSHRLELELTESALMEDLPHTRETLEALGKIGVGVAIDDFGAGASSLGDLKNLPFTKLKIDRAFVTQVPSRHDSQAICAALIELGRRLDVAVLAEGVETREEVEALRVLGCQLFQGFFFARPLPVDKFVRKLADPDWLALIAAPARRELPELEQRLAS
jgi:EAL domain-containing protein (putative c-di-GMP-specific phosphodiesterase class I)/GGDEF domain-containing protein